MGNSRFIFLLVLAAGASLLAMGPRPPFLATVGVTQWKDKGGKWPSDFEFDLSGKVGALDGSNLTYKALKSPKCVEELAHALHSNVAFQLPKCVYSEIKATFNNRLLAIKAAKSNFIAVLDGRDSEGKGEEAASRKERKDARYRDALALKVKRDEQTRVLFDLDREYRRLACEPNRTPEETIRFETLGKDRTAAQKALKDTEKDMATAFGDSVGRNDEITTCVVEVCGELGIRIAVALEEADHQIERLIEGGTCHYAISEDGDMILHGVDTLFGFIDKVYQKNAKFPVKAAFVKFTDLQREHKYKGRTYDFRQWTSKLPWQIYGLIMGQDYTDHGSAKESLSGAGPVESYNIVTTFLKERAANASLGIEGALRIALGSSRVLVDRADAALEAVMFGLAVFNASYVWDYGTLQQHRLDPNWPLTPVQEDRLGAPVPQVCLVQCVCVCVCECIRLRQWERGE
jgi:5'-3' exonuclease